MPKRFESRIVSASRARRLRATTIAAAAAGALSLAPAAFGQEAPAPADVAAAPVSVNLNITPKRLVLQGNKAGTVTIFNHGNSPATFDISLVERVMLPNGEIKTLTEAAADPSLQPLVGRLASAQNFLDAAPRRVVLDPNESQVVRIRQRRPAAGGGEYRTHLTVATVPPRDTGVTAEQAQAAGSGQLSFRITSVFGLSIPVIVRPRTVDIRGAIENARLGFADISPDGIAPPVRTPVILFDLHRVGANSLFGNLEVKAVRGRDRDALGVIRGVGVYPEIDRRTMQIPLKRTLKPGEQVEIIFTDDDSNPGRVVARSSLTAT